jgi:hypothetical protein
MFFWLYQQIQKICCPRIKRDENTIVSSKLPWVWIGFTFADGTVADMTYEINSAIQYDIKVVNTEFLRSVVPVHPSLTWKYIDAETLEEKDFPSNGLLIDGN